MELKTIEEYTLLDGYAHDVTDGETGIGDRCVIAEKHILTDYDGYDVNALGLRLLYSMDRIILDRDEVLELLKFIDDSKILNVD